MSLLVAAGLFLVLTQSPLTNGASVSGVVTEAVTQKPVAGVEITLFKFDGAERPVQHSAVTDREGHYTFENIGAGEYRVTVRKAGYAVMDGVESLELSVRPGSAREAMNLVLTKAAVIVGRVLDEEGEPVVGVQVFVMRKPAHMQQVASQSHLPFFPAGQVAQTNDLGEFRVFGLPAHDAYFVLASPNVFQAAASPSRTIRVPTYYPSATDAQAAQPIAVGAGQTSGDVVIRMASVASFQVSGVVIDQAGRPVANALVRVMPDENAERLFMLNEGPTHTDAQGKFVIGSMTSGSYSLLAIAPNVVSRSPAPSDGLHRGSFSYTGGMTGIGIDGGVTSETANGVTTEYRDNAGTPFQITIENANVEGIEITVRRQAR